MFDPMRARLASSCSKNGIKPVTIDTNCFGETSICVTVLVSASKASPRYLAQHTGSTNILYSSKFAEA
ncbi:Uncharacterised protein [Chlamydia abortus]|nr:Uncharacterised protein [Chlamydia abortus]